MRKPDLEVREVVCSETGKPMPKIPLWMAGIQVKFVSDEARQKHSSGSGILEIEPERRSIGSGSDLEELKDLGLGVAASDDEEDFEEPEAEEASEDYDS